MDKRQYLIEALQANTYHRKDWILSTFTLVRPTYAPPEGYPYEIVFKESDDVVYFIDPSSDNLSVIEGASKTSPIFNIKDRITLQPFDLPNVKDTTETNLGNVLVNCILFVYPFGDKVPFITGKIKSSKIESITSGLLTDVPPNGVERVKGKIYVDEYLKHAEAASALAGLSPICVPSASPKTMSVSPDVIKRRDELLEQYKDQLLDPAILARIDTELSALDREWFKGDAGEGFLLKAKAFDVSRKRAFIMVGAESGFSESDEGIVPITKSLVEGWDTEHLAAMINNLRSGIYNRGHETALGGESVKFFYRVFQNTKIIEDDCGSEDGINWVITERNYNKFTGIYRVGETTPLTTAIAKGLIGKTIKLRSPQRCKSAAPSFCAKCMGDLLAVNPTGLHIAASDVGSIFMSTFMAAMHGKALRTSKYDYKLSIQ